jgi:hypothetical protein
MDTFDICSLCFSCTLPVPHNFNSLNTIYGQLESVIYVTTGYTQDSIWFELPYVSDWCDKCLQVGQYMV